ncbi:hypothetical protein PR048_013193, partial [Dryococelus australis]
MEAKLCTFYIECVLPELVDPRFPRSMPIQNPRLSFTRVYNTEMLESPKHVVVAPCKISNAVKTYSPVKWYAHLVTEERKNTWVNDEGLHK